MWRSEKNVVAAIGLAALACILASGARPVSAGEEAIRVYESSFNGFTSAIQPVTVNGHYDLKVKIDTGLFGSHWVTICSSDYTASVTGLSFHITPGGVTVDGSVNASWCHLSFSSSDLDASGNIYYSGSDKTLRFSFSSASVQPCFTGDFWILGRYTVCMPFRINIAPTLNIPPLPIRTTSLVFETAGGPKRLFVNPDNVSLTKQNGYVELRSDAYVW